MGHVVTMQPGEGPLLVTRGLVRSAMRVELVRFVARGRPVAQGSLKAFQPPGARFPVLTSTAKGLKAWRDIVAWEARRAWPGAPCEDPIALTLSFAVPKPKSAPKRRRTFAVKRPDLDKLTRAVKDALSDVVYGDDSQVVEVTAAKDWPREGEGPGVAVVVFRVEAVG